MRDTTKQLLDAGWRTRRGYPLYRRWYHFDHCVEGTSYGRALEIMEEKAKAADVDPGDALS